MHLKSFLSASILMGVLVLPCPAGERQAVVRIVTPRDGGQSQCSGVCVSSAGHVLTAKHCRPDDRTRVWFGETSYAARVLYAPDSAEGVVVLKVDAENELPRVDIAANPPEPGEPVYSLGFPAGQWSRNEGYVTRTVQAGGLVLIEASFRVLGGNSGGPLFNQQGRVVGLASTRSLLPDELRYRSLRQGFPYDPRQAEPASFWLHTADLQRALDAAVRAEREGRDAAARIRPRFYAFTEPRACIPCRRFAQDRAGNLGGLGELVARFDYQEVRWNGLAWDKPQAVQLFESRFGRRPPATPTFWVDGAPQHLVGYPAGKGGRQLQEYLDRFARPGDDGSRRAAMAEVDWADVMLVVLVAEREANALRGTIRRRSLQAASGPLERRVAELTDGKARLVVVAQRTEPLRFEAVSQAARVDADPACVLVLVARQEIGLKGLIAAKVEKILAERLEDAPVDFVFERVHRADYTAILESLAAAEPEPVPRNEDPAASRWGLEEIGSRLEGLSGAVEALRGLVVERGPSREDDRPEQLPVDQLAVAAVSAWATERLKLLAKLRWLAGLVLTGRRV